VHLIDLYLIGLHFINLHLIGLTKREGEAGKEAQAIGLASQSDGQKSDGQTDRQVEDRQTDRQTDRQVETRPMSAGTQADRAAS
jgi:hypothetical protein